MADAFLAGEVVTGEWCISDAYGTTVMIGGKEEIEALIDELKKILEEKSS